MTSSWANWRSRTLAPPIAMITCGICCAPKSFSPGVFSVLLAMKGRNAAALAARRLSRRSDHERRADVRAQREWLSRAEKFGRRVDATLAALHAEHPQVASACGYQPGPE